METMTVAEIVQAVHGKLLAGPGETLSITAVDTDSRKIQAGSLFAALIGERTDGHQYVDRALNDGAAACIVSRVPDHFLPGKAYILVGDTLRGVQELAGYYRSKFHIPVVAVTGSVGKTTTKDMIAAVLSEHYSVLKTEKNHNNSLGMPLTLLNLGPQHDIAVIELGMSQAGEIDCLTKLAKPDVAVITNIGDAHIENLGSRENILKAKCEIFQGMGEDGLAILNGDDELLSTLRDSLSMETVYCGEGLDCAYQASAIHETTNDCMECKVKTPYGEYGVQIPAVGRHMIYPVLMAAAVGEHFGLSAEEIVDGVHHFVPTSMRMDIIYRRDDIVILNDTYNANPQSMRAAVEVLATRRERKKVAVLGDMFELGALAPALHAGVGEYLGRAGIQWLVAVGELANHLADAAERAGVAHVFRCADKEAAKPVLAQLLEPDTVFLVKASRGMAMEELVEELERLTVEEA